MIPPRKIPLLLALMLASWALIIAGMWAALGIPASHTETGALLTSAASRPIPSGGDLYSQEAPVSSFPRELMLDETALSLDQLHSLSPSELVDVAEPSLSPHERMAKLGVDASYVEGICDAGFVTLPASATDAELRQFASEIYPACREYETASIAFWQTHDITRLEIQSFALLESSWAIADRLWPGREEPLKGKPWNKRERP